MGKRTWTDEQIKIIKKKYGKIENKELSVILNKSVKALVAKAGELNLTNKFKISNSGDIFGRLTLVKEGPRGNSANRRWYCKCYCGKVFLTNLSAVRNGITMSCGCFKQEVNMRPAGMRSYKTLYLTYSINAKKREYEFILTLEEFIALIAQNCFYCGDKPTPYNAYLLADMKTVAQSAKCILPETIDRATIYANGIDRTDNEKGYTLENSVPCCWPCNSLKARLSQQDFLDLINKISYYQNNKNINQQLKAS